MIRTIYKLLLRAPEVRGRHRLDALLRRMQAPRADRLPEGFRMELDPQEWLQIDLLAGRNPEPRTAALIGRLLEPGDVFVDIGAHVGWLSLIAAGRVGAQGRVVAVDPQPYNCDRILRNAALNGYANIVVAPVAISDRDDFLLLSAQPARDRARLTLSGPGVNDTRIRHLCPCLRLDSLLDQLSVDAPGVIKIDVEGHEREVLAGGARALASAHDVIYEALPTTDLAAGEDAERILRQAGFSLFDIDGQPWTPGRPAPENNVWARRG